MSELSSRSEYPAFRQALQVGLVYLVVSVVWIYFSDLAVERLFSDPSAIRRAQTWKGWAFVGASAALIVFLVFRELARSREVGDRFRALVEQSLAGVYLIQKGRFRYVNPTLAGIFGYEPRKMVDDLRVEEVVAPEDRELVLHNISRREEGGDDELHYRFSGLRSDGETVRVEVHGSRIAWDGAPAVLGVLLDVSEGERLERQVREAQKMEALGTITGQVAHDFNNFLTAIIGPLDLCRSILPAGGEARREVEEARETAMRAASLSRKLLTFSRRRTSLPRLVEVSSRVRDVEPLLRRLVPQGVELRLVLDPEERLVSIDPSDLEQILVNLVMNAGQAVEGRGTVEIRTGRGGEDRIVIQVKDDGKGMDEGVLSKIFQPFFTTKREGTGLGLSTVYGIVKQAGGDLDVESEPGVGTTLTIELPRAEGEASVEADRAPEPPGSLKGSEVILLVEDEDAVRRTVRKALRRAGYTVLAAADGEAARELAAGTPVELLLTDVQLPDVLGPDLAREMRELYPELRILYMSGYSDREVTESLGRNPSVRLLEKPFSMDDLLRAVDDALAQGGDSSEGRAG